MKIIPVDGDSKPGLSKKRPQTNCVVKKQIENECQKINSGGSDPSMATQGSKPIFPSNDDYMLV